jgi:hypothetical protein
MTTQATPSRPRNGSEISDRLTTEDEVRTLLFNRVSWGAVLAGVMVALVTQLILNLIGIGVGAASFDPTSNANPSGSTFSIVAGIWWALSGILAALAGGYTAGRLSGKPTETSGPWHGLTAWAVTTLLVFYLLSTSVGAIIGGAFRTFGTVVGGAAQSLGSTAQTVAPTLAHSSDPFASIDQSIRSATGATDPAALRDAATAAVRAALTSDTAGQEQARERAVQALAKAQNIGVDQARTQVAEYEQQYRRVVEQAKRQATAAADATTTAVSRGALFGAIALILGAVAAWFGGRMGALDPSELATALRRRRLN